MEEWAAEINASLSDISCRPRTLLVIVNPWGGNGQANRVWSKQAYPILSQAGQSCWQTLVLAKHSLILESQCTNVAPSYIQIKWSCECAKFEPGTPHGARMLPMPCAGVRCVLLETRNAAHAKDIVASLPIHELKLYDGILAVHLLLPACASHQ